MTTTYPEKTDTALGEERTDWNRQITERDSKIADQENTILGLQAKLAECMKGDESDIERLSSIQVFPDRKDFPLYYDHDTVLAHLDSLGIKRVRGNLGPNTDARTLSFYSRAYDTLGIQAFLTIGQPRVPITPPQWDAIEDKLRGLGDAVDSIYGWNEPDNQRNASDPPVTNWVPLTVAHQKSLSSLGSELHLPVGTPSLHSGNPANSITNMGKLKSNGMTAADYDIIAYHLYPRNNDTAAKIAAFYGNYEAQLRTALTDIDSPFACTEYGLSTAPKQGTSQAVRVTEQQRAERLRLLVAYHVDHGNRHSWFELKNTEDPTQADREDWLGLVWVDGTETPGFTAYQQMLATYKPA